MSRPRFSEQAAKLDQAAAMVENLEVSDRRVTAELSVVPRAAGCADLAQLFGFAAELSRAGVEGRHGAGFCFCATDAKTIYMVPVPASRLLGEAVPLPAPEGMAVWQTSIRTVQNKPVAMIVESGPVRPVAWRARAGADRDGAAPAMAVPQAVCPRKDRIIAAATEVIAQKGFGNATIREIAEVAGVHVPTLYQHVSGKDELLELVYSHEMERLGAELDSAGAAEGSASSRLERMISVALDVSQRRHRQIGILNRELKGLGPEARARTLAQYRKLVERYETVLAEGIASGEFHEIDHLMAANFIDMVSDMWALRPFFFRDYDPEEYRRTAVEFILAGLRRAGR